MQNSGFGTSKHENGVKPSPFDRAHRVLCWSPLWTNCSGKYANPDPRYPTSHMWEVIPTRRRCADWSTKEQMSCAIFVFVWIVVSSRRCLWKIIFDHRISQFFLTRNLSISSAYLITYHNKFKFDRKMWELNGLINSISIIFTNESNSTIQLKQIIGRTFICKRAQFWLKSDIFFPDICTLKIQEQERQWTELIGSKDELNKHTNDRRLIASFRCPTSMTKTFPIDGTITMNAMFSIA